MSKSAEEEAFEEAGERLALAEAELESLKEEVVALRATGMGPHVTAYPKRLAFVSLSIGRLEKQIPKMRTRIEKDRVHADWLARINAQKR